MLHIARQMESCASFGSVVLNKILFYADHIHYRDTGKKITNFKYVRQPMGPTPAPAEYMPIKTLLINKRDAKEETRDYFGRPQKRLLALALPDYSVFSREELATLEAAINSFRTVNGSTASEISHQQELGWQLAGQMEDIPASTFLLIEDDISDTDIAWGKKHFDKFSKSRMAVRN